MTFAELLETARDAGHISDADREAALATGPIPENDKRTPWYLQAMSAVGAWFAAVMLLGFFFSILSGELFRSGASAVVTGTVLLAICTVVRRVSNGMFLSQICLAGSAAGHGLVIYGAAQVSNEFFAAVMVSIAVAAVLYVPYKDALHRFLSPLAALAVFAVWLQTRDDHWIVYPLNVIAHVAALGIVFLSSRSPGTLRPLGYALAISLAYTVLPFAHRVSFTDYVAALIWAWIPRLVLGGALYGLAIWALGGRAEAMKPERRSLLIGVTVAMILLTAFTSTAILVSLGLLMLGYGLQDGVLTAVGLILLPVHIGLFYYELRVPLLNKSVLLMISGAILLAVWGLISRLPQTEDRSA